MATNNAWNNTVSNANVSFSGGTFTVASGTNAINISADAAATTVNVASGAGAKTVQIGSTNSSSSLALRYGTSDMTMASATGTVMSALDTGEINYPLQPAFLALNSATDSNVTGAGTLYQLVCDSEIFDQNSDYNNGTGVFTAPVTGRYYLQTYALVIGTTIATQLTQFIQTSNRTYIISIDRAASANPFYGQISCFTDMDAGDTGIAFVRTSGEAGDTDDVSGAAGSPATSFSGHLVC